MSEKESIGARIARKHVTHADDVRLIAAAIDAEIALQVRAAQDARSEMLAHERQRAEKAERERDVAVRDCKAAWAALDEAQASLARLEEAARAVRAVHDEYQRGRGFSGPSLSAKIQALRARDERGRGDG